MSLEVRELLFLELFNYSASMLLAEDIAELDLPDRHDNLDLIYPSMTALYLTLSSTLEPRISFLEFSHFSLLSSSYCFLMPIVANDYS